MNKLTKSVFFVLGLSAFSLAGCDDDSNVIGLNDATKHGYIKITLEGRDPNGDDFEVTRNFKFSPSGSPDDVSSVYTYTGDGFYQNFYVTRYLGLFNAGNGSDSYAGLNLYNDNPEDGEDFNFIESGLYFTTSITTDDQEFFSLNEYISIGNDDVTSYKYNAETGKLSLKFSNTQEDSDTGYPLKVTVNVNVTVFEEVGIEL